MSLKAFTTLDFILAAILVFAVFKGWRRGFIKTVCSLLGIFAGIIVGQYIINNWATAQSDTTFLRWSAQVVIFLISASIGSGVGGYIGKKVSEALSWKPIELVDQIIGATISLAGWTLVFWIVATSLLVMPIESVSTKIHNSQIIRLLDQQIPASLRSEIDNWRGIESQSFNLSKTAD